MFCKKQYFTPDDLFKKLAGTKTYKPAHSENRMKFEGDIKRSRKFFFSESSLNLRRLVSKRYLWMNKYINENDYGVDIGCGAGLSREFIKCKNFKLTDISDYEWLDLKNIDALNTGLEANSLDFIVSSNMIHHLPYPSKFFAEMARILKPNGLLLIQEINASFFMRIVLRLMKHEGYSFNINVFDPEIICTNPEDPWSANCAIPNLLFDHKDVFEHNIPYFKMEKHSYSEFLCFLNSGGVIAKTICIPLPSFALKFIEGIDWALSRFCPSVFALQRQIVLRNVK